MKEEDDGGGGVGEEPTNLVQTRESHTGVTPDFLVIWNNFKGIREI